MTRQLRALILLCLTGLAATGQGAPSVETPAPAAAPNPDRATSGYLPAASCAQCHPALHASYQAVGMSRSFSRPKDGVFIEDFQNNHFYHAPSKRHYEMLRKGDRLLFRRYQLDDAGKPINLFELPVDWILGSGYRTRSYLYQTDAGELYQLPIGWYSQGRHWGMAPGFDQPRHPGVLRRVPRQCMFCHNAYPDVPEGSDLHWQPHIFPHELPEGTGCQRCHGPGQAHVAEVLNGKGDVAAIRAAIVNPGRMSAERQLEVCEQCHLLPAIAMTGVRRFDRPVYAHRPGEPLDDYLLHVDIDELGRQRGDRFEINHHPYRLKQSACFIRSAGKLTCLNCHDPHRKVGEPERAAHYRKACLACHTAHGPMTSAIDAPPDDCVACHMPMRRTQDVVQVTMTDHRIQRLPPGPERLAPLPETVPTITGIAFLHPDRAPDGSLGEIYKAVAVLRAYPSDSAIDWLQQQLVKTRVDSLEPYLELAKAQIAKQRFAAAKDTLTRIIRRAPDDPQALSWLGELALIDKQVKKAEGYQRQAIAARPFFPEAHYQLGLTLLAQDRHREALTAFDQAIAQRPVMVRAWFKGGDTLTALGRPQAAIEHYRRTLALSPGFDRAYLRLAQALAKAGDKPEAIRYLRHGLRVSKRLPAMEDLLKELTAGAADAPAQAAN